MRRPIFVFGCLVLATASAVIPAALAQKTHAVNPQSRQSQSAPDHLVKEVRHELVMLPRYGVFDNLSYRVDGNNVTLMGQVTNPTLKSDAGNVVKQIEGIGAVNNEITVLPPSSMDDGIRIAEYRAIYSDPSLNRYALQAVPPIHIIVDNGRVTLEGVVDTPADKNLAGMRAQAVPGTFAITNNLRAER